MKILSIDTSSSICSVAILDDLTVLEEISIDNQKTHSQNLMPMIKRVFEMVNLSIKDIDMISCNKGPGSFTGIRIGIATAKGLAEPYNINIIGVSSLEGLSYNITTTQGYICSLIDARNENVYFGLFDNKYNKIEEFRAIHVSEVNEVLKKYKEAICFVGDGAKNYKEKIYKKEIDKFASDKEDKASSVSIAKAAFTKLKLGNIESESPLYLRPSQAERLKGQ